MGIESKAAGNAKVGRMVITGGKNRVLVARKPRAKEWTLERQATFLEELAMTGNVTTSVVVVGMSLGGAYHRRSHDPAFAAAWQAALSRGYDRLEELLLATSLASLNRDDGRLTVISGLTGLPGEGAPFVLAVGAYAVDIDADGVGWVRVLAAGSAGRVAVAYSAGLAMSFEAVPAPIAQGVAMLVAHLFDHRESDVAPPAAVAALWRPYRRMRLCLEVHS